MRDSFQIPQPTTLLHTSLHPLEQQLVNQSTRIEAWFRDQWQQAPLLFYSSVDLRNAGFKLAPVDTNLFPAGFNNLSAQSLPLAIQAVQSTMSQLCSDTKQILLIPENHTRNVFYFEHLARLQEIIVKAGFEVRIGSLLPELKIAKEVTLPSGASLRLEPLTRKGDRLCINDFSPCLILLNNDLADGIPELLQNLEQKVLPSLSLGWDKRSKANHFYHYKNITENFAAHIDIDPWLIGSLFRYCGEINFMTGEGEQCVIGHTEALLQSIAEKYQQYGIQHPPYVVIKADAGTYGMAVMMVKDAQEIKQLNRKQRMSMSATKGGRGVSKVIIQEGVYSFETWGEHQAVAEPVVYMVGRHVVGGFYRIHDKKKADENLNSPGMNFEPIPFSDTCNNPCQSSNVPANRFYAYGVIARLAMLAAARELAESMKENTK